MAAPRIFIVEGIPGAGKSAVIEELLQRFDAAHTPVYHFEEDALLLSWKHFSLPQIVTIRMDLMASLVRFMQQTLEEAPETVFILNRFHLSYWLEHAPAHHPDRYDHLIEALRSLPTEILVPVLAVHELARVHHPERSAQEHVWDLFLQRRAANSPFPGPEALYWDQQQRMLGLLERQGLPYRLLAVPLMKTTK